MAYGSQAVWWWHGTLSGGAYVDMKTHGGSIEFNDPKPAKQAPELKGEHARYRLDRESVLERLNSGTIMRCRPRARKRRRCQSRIAIWRLKRRSQSFPHSGVAATPRRSFPTRLPIFFLASPAVDEDR